MSEVSIIPKPVRLEMGTGEFPLNSSTVIITDGSEATAGVAKYLTNYLREYANFSLPIRTSADGAKSITITTKGADASLGEEGYELSMTPDAITIRSTGAAGLFYGVQTIRQLLPVTFEEKPSDAGMTWALPCVNVMDKPRFGWRGLMIDSSRTFQPLPYLRQYIDLMALYKMNIFHWHFTDDNGWRMEVKKYPKLTRVGARYDERYNTIGGYYTQEEMRDFVAYAAERHIMVVPEVELPGHCAAVIAAYPEYSCKDDPGARVIPWSSGEAPGIQPYVFCAGKEESFQMLEDVLDETIELFPSPYIHVGADEVVFDHWKECPRCQERIKAEGLKDERELQSYFVKRIEKYLNSKGRTLVGWDEILYGGLAPNATLMAWRSIDLGVTAIQEGHDVVFTPTKYCYFDFDPKVYSVDNAYSYEPVPEGLTPEQEKHVLGLQGSMWTAGCRSEDTIDRFILPRMLATAEVAWSPRELRSFGDFRSRLQPHLERLDAIDMKHSGITTGQVVWHWWRNAIPETPKTFDWDVTTNMDRPGIYDIRIRFNWGKNSVNTEWIALLEDGKELARDAHPAVLGSAGEENTYHLKLDALKPGAKYTLRASLRSEGGTDSSGVVHMLAPE